MENITENSLTAITSEIIEEFKPIEMKEEELQDILEPKKKDCWKPDISHLDNAVVDGVLMVPIGGKLLIEYTNCPWRDTTVWIIEEINPIEGHLAYGHVRLWDPNKWQFGCTNYLNGQQKGLTFKIPDKSRRWVPGDNQPILSKHKMREQLELIEGEVKPTIDSDGNPLKRKRGRPKGSLGKKNK